MNYSNKRPNQLKHYASIVLVMFVVSILNMSMQMPAHAAMQHQSMEMSATPSMMDHSVMQGADMHDCACPPVLCESVDAQHDQHNQTVSSVAMLDLLTFYPVFVDIQVDTQHHLADISFQFHDWQYRQHSPPPLSLTTILHI